ncbi:hypothetical protein NNJEOMEG_03298 [Fundidesulfovibrio magnetotacticus]|uniref:Uncharacterized protein n=1 Tax=Fundidesulfovibrio magnetotacticus TaxID=2730080 RepID=A0A6V8M4Q4_9BACT|nr:hypothetical protein [Fundidesulfovibrio magnetotacticus]GFK95435.1 hypothetical protein NNJEOMEG_03298 [Fundidesulfovibrio magnetotacticus]
MVRIRRYFWNVLLGLDQFLSVLTGGDPDETVSSRVGKAAVAGSRMGLALEWCLDHVFGAGHCRSSIEPDEGGGKVVPW